MTEQELIEALSDKEHSSWARWMAYLFSKCDDWYETDVDDQGIYAGKIIPLELVERWQRQIETPYAELSEREKQSDREEVAHILPIIEEYALRESKYTTTFRWVENNGIEHTFQSKDKNEVYTKANELLADYLLCKIRHFTIVEV